MKAKKEAHYTPLGVLVFTRIVFDTGTSRNKTTSLNGMVDTGAVGANFMDTAEMKRCGLLHLLKEKRGSAKQGVGRLDTIGTITIPNAMTYDGHACGDTTFSVVRDLSLPCILSNDWLRQQEAVLDFTREAVRENRMLTFPKSYMVADVCTDIKSRRSAPRLLTLEGRTPEFDPGDVIYEVSVAELLRTGDQDDEELDDTYDTHASLGDDGSKQAVTDLPEFDELFNRYADVFSKDKEVPPRRGQYDMVVTLIDPNRGCNQRAYRVSPHEARVMREQLKKKLGPRLLCPSDSAYASPILFVKKALKDSDPRMCTDYRVINTNTVKDRYGLPRVSDMIERLAGYQVYSAFDFQSYFWQLRCSADSEQYNAMITPTDGLLQSPCVRQGQCNGAQTAQRVTDAALRGDPLVLPRYETTHVRFEAAEAAYAKHTATTPEGRYTNPLEDLRYCASGYIDDCVVRSRNRTDHLLHLEKFLERMQLLGLKLHRPEFICARSINFLGHRVSGTGTQPLTSRTEAFKTWDAPRSVADVQRFLGSTGFYRSYVPRYAHYASLLTPFTTKAFANAGGWKDDSWKPEHEAAFSYIRDALANAVELAQPDESRPFIICTDGSRVGIGATLHQHDTSTQQLRLVGCYSRATTGPISRWSQIEIELKALEQSCLHWRHLIRGRSDTIAYTDNKALVTGGILIRQQEHARSSRVIRIIWNIQDLNIDLRWHANTAELAQIPDALSRLPQYQEAFTRNMDEWIRSIGREVAHRPETYPSVLAIQTDQPTFMDEVRLAMETMTNEEARDAGYIRDDDGIVRDETQRIVVPDDVGLRKRIVTHYHDHHGHRGVTQTLRAIERTFAIDASMRDLVATHVRDCTTCVRAKSLAIRRRARPSRPLELPRGWWQNIVFDFITDLPESTENGFDRLAVFADQFSKYTILVPCHSTITAEEFAKLFIRWVFPIAGIPEMWHSDNDTVITATTFQLVMEQLGVNTRDGLALPFAKSVQGQAEKLNSVVEELMRVFCTEYEDWAEPHVLSTIQFTINATPSTVTDVSPFVAHQGWTPRAPRELAAPVATEGEITSRMQEVREFVTLNLLERREAATQLGRRGRVQTIFRVGQWVHVADQQGRLQTSWHKKLSDCAVGPFPIVEVLPYDRYRIQLPQSASLRRRDVFDADDLRAAALPDLATEVNDDGVIEIVYTIKEIIGHQHVGRGRNRVLSGVLLDFEGDWPHEWHLVDDIAATAPDLLRAYVQRHRIKLASTTRALLRL